MRLVLPRKSIDTLKVPGYLCLLSSAQIVPDIHSHFDGKRREDRAEHVNGEGTRLRIPML